MNLFSHLPSRHCHRTGHCHWLDRFHQVAVRGMLRRDCMTRLICAVCWVAKMDLAGIREALHRQPFEPFALRLADGRSLAVSHPDFVAIGARRIVVIGPDDSSSFVEPPLIVSTDWLPPGKNGGNGSRGRKRPS